MNEPWIAVAQYDVAKRDGWKTSLSMTSVLAETDSPEALLANSEWLAYNDFGKTEVWEDDGKIRVEEQTEEYVGKNGDVRIEPFTFMRHWNDTWPSRFELIQNFILFYNLHFDVKEGKYVAVDGAGETTDVAKVINEENREKIEIRATFLRNYLACRKRVLIRQHDNRVRSDRSLVDLGIEPLIRKLVDSNYVFDLTVDDYDIGKRPTFSRLLGKDLVRPYPKCKHLLDFRTGNYEFIVGVDEEGNNITASYNEGDGPTHFLIPVYFKREVLKKYYDSEKYKVES